MVEYRTGRGRKDRWRVSKRAPVGEACAIMLAFETATITFLLLGGRLGRKFFTLPLSLPQAWGTV